MYPARFDYFAPATLEEVIGTLAERGDDAKVMAGGQSLIPLMKLRIASPVVDRRPERRPGPRVCDEVQDGLRIGALVRHKTCRASPLLRKRYRLLGDAAPQISDPLVRNRGTVCGSLAHADPQGDWGAAMLAARGEVVAQGPSGERTIPIDDLLRGPFTTTLSPDEVITEARVPDPGPRTSGTYLKLERKVGDYATAAVAIQVTLDNGTSARPVSPSPASARPTCVQLRPRTRSAEQSLPMPRSRTPRGWPRRPPSRNRTSEARPTTSATSSASSRSGASGPRSRERRAERSE